MAKLTEANFGEQAKGESPGSEAIQIELESAIVKVGARNMEERLWQ